MAKSKPKKTTKAKSTKAPARKKTTAAKATPRKVAKSTPKQPASKPVGRRRIGDTKPAVPAGTANQAFVRTGQTLSANAKPGRNQAGLKQKELQQFRDALLIKRRELLGDVASMESEALRTTGGGSNLSNLPIHMADMGTDNYEQEFTLGLVEKDRQLLREINIALVKIRDGSYGICEGTGKPIGKPRLEAQPWARYSIEYMRKLEKGLLRR